MIIYQNSLITISYSSETDILTANWPDFEPYLSLEVKESLDKLIEALQKYDVKNLVIDASKAKVNIDYDEYRDINKEFLENLNKTRLQKFARVMTSDPQREANVLSLKQDEEILFQHEDFKTEEDALKWLAS